MLKKLYVNGQTIEYSFVRKNVKNINLRIKSDGSITVSANIFIPAGAVEAFVASKADFILGALQKQRDKKYQPPTEYCTEQEIVSLTEEICRKVYPYFEKRGVSFPVIKFRNMVSRWGSCHASKGIVTFNTKLRFVPKDLVEYVVLHEFTHFLQPNHSSKFYQELSKTCPDWKEKRKLLKNINTEQE